MSPPSLGWASPSHGYLLLPKGIPSPWAPHGQPFSCGGVSWAPHGHPSMGTSPLHGQPRGHGHSHGHQHLLSVGTPSNGGSLGHPPGISPLPSPLPPPLFRGSCGFPPTHGGKFWGCKGCGVGPQGCASSPLNPLCVPRGPWALRGCCKGPLGELWAPLSPLFPSGVLREVGTEFTVDARALAPTGGPHVRARVLNPSGTPIDTFVTDLGDGTYRVEYTPFEEGEGPPQPPWEAQHSQGPPDPLGEHGHPQWTPKPLGTPTPWGAPTHPRNLQGA